MKKTYCIKCGKIRKTRNDGIRLAPYCFDCLNFEEETVQKLNSSRKKKGLNQNSNE